MEVFMKYGYFDDINREYVITDPATPLPWINYLGCRDFFSLISNTCGGYSFYKDAKLLRLTRYRYNNVPADSNGRYFYLKEGNSIWNPGWQPTQTPLDFYECRHGMGYSRFTGQKNHLKASLLTFVPLEDSCEINQLTLTNDSEREKTIQLFSYLEWCLWNADDDMKNFQRNFSTGEVEIEGSILYHKTEYRERRNHYALFSVNTPITAFETDRDSFLGPYRSNQNPSAVEKGQLSNSVASGWSPIAAHQIDLTLQPGESKTFIFVTAYVEVPVEEKWEAPGVINKKPAHALLSRYSNPDQVQDAFLALRHYWTALLSRYHISSDSREVDRMVNIWNQYQCMVTFNMSRSASYYESGIGRGMGFRDSCQDLLGFVHLIPERARERILDIAATQFEDGSAYHQYQPLTKRGNADIGGGFNDDPLWLIAGTVAYIKETGDFSILKEPVTFNSTPGTQQPLLEHLKRSFDFTVTNKGPHGLPLIGRADWNDCLNLNCFSAEPGESFQTFGPSEGPVAESVFIAGMFVKYGEEYAQLVSLLGNAVEAVRARKEVAAVYQAVLDSGWDGEWFLRAYDAYSHKVGSRECEEGQIFIEPQGFCVLAGIGVQEGLAQKALDSVQKHLDTKYHLELGEVSSYPPGYKENAGIFCHNNPWISIAETVIGRGNRAFEVYRKTCPAYLEDISDIHRTEPYVYAQMVAGADAPRHGEAKNSWLTGTAAWTFVNISQYILGICPDWNGLRINPCIPSDCSGYDIHRHYRNADYDIHIQNPNHVEKGVVSLLVDGTPIDGCVVPFTKDKQHYDVTVVMG